MVEVGKKPIRVLIVDDEVSYGAVLVKRLAVRKIEAAFRPSGREAIQLLRNMDFDVSLLDLKMEQMDGLEVLKVFGMLAPHMKVIIVTGHGGEAEAKAAIKGGAFDYLVKPCNLDDVVTAIERAAQASWDSRWGRK